MKPIHDLCSAAAEFEYWIERGLNILKKHRKRMRSKKDARAIIDILGVLNKLEYDIAKYKEWAEREAEAIEKLTES